MSDVSQWLNELGLSRYVDAFKKHEVDFEVLPELTEADLVTIGIPLGPRKKLLKTIATLSADAQKSSSKGELVPPTQVAPEAERRQLTVMFVDLVDSTVLARELDPEDFREVLRTFQEACADVVARYGGHVAKYQGDGILIYFGYPLAHEDDAERAVHTGLAIVEAVGVLSFEPKVTLRVRLGIATGLVVVGDIIGERVEDVGVVTGETPHLAARLQTIAEPSTVVIAEGTRQLLGERFDYEEFASRRLKGFAEPIRAWRVSRELPAESRFEVAHATDLTPFVGRDEEVDLLSRRWEQAREREGQVVLLSGEPGIGKSRIAVALTERIEASARGDGARTIVCRFQCSPHHVNTAFYPTIRYIYRTTGILVEDSPEVQLEKLKTGSEALGIENPESLAIFASLLSLPAEGPLLPRDLQPHRLRALTIEAIAGTFLKLSKAGPILVIFEDAHWADPSTLEFVERAVRKFSDHRIFFLITCRPEFRHDLDNFPHVSFVQLSRMGRRHSKELVTLVAGQRGLPEDIIARIVDQTDGVPLYIEELTRVVAESAPADRADGDFGIPTSLRDSLMERIDRTGPAKQLMQMAAVIGREFTRDHLAHVAGVEEVSLDQKIERLLSAGLIYSSDVQGENRFRFKHSLVHDVAYDSLLRRRRKALHARVAEALVEHFEPVAKREPETLAYHYEQAQRWSDAALQLERAGLTAGRRGAQKEAEAYLGEALSMLERLPQGKEKDTLELRLQMSNGHLRQVGRGYGAEGTESPYARARELAELLGDGPAMFISFAGLFAHNLGRALMPEALDLANDIIALAGATGNDSAAMWGNTFACGVHCNSGSGTEAVAAADKAIALYNPKEHARDVLRFSHDSRVLSLQYRGIALWGMGFPDQSLECHIAMEDHARALGHRYSLGQALVWGMLAVRFRGDYRGWRSRCTEAEAIADELGHRYVLHTARCWLGWMDVRDGRIDQGLALIEPAFAGYVAAGTRLGLPYMAAHYADALLRAERIDEASAVLQDALAICADCKHSVAQVEILRLIAACHLARPRPNSRAGEATLKQAVQLAGVQNAPGWGLRPRTDLARLYSDQGRMQQAYDMLAPAYSWFTEGLDTEDLVDAKAVLQSLELSDAALQKD